MLLQLLEYQNAIYQKTEGPLIPVIPIIVYHGKTKTYSGPKKLHDILEYPKGEMGELLKRFVLGFECFLLNVHDLDVEENSDLTLGPILYIMRSIFNLDREVVKKLFAQGKHLPDDERLSQMMMAIKYIQRVDPSFDWELIKEVAKEEEKGEETVTLLGKTIDEMVSEGIEEGIEKGMEKGIEKGMEKGIEKGIEKGVEKGRIAERKEIAKILLASGADPKFVAKATRLTLKEVKELSSKR